MAENFGKWLDRNGYRGPSGYETPQPADYEQEPDSLQEAVIITNRQRRGEISTGRYDGFSPTRLVAIIKAKKQLQS